MGMERSDGKYIAFCDDDDRWFPTKIELQIDAMKKTGCKMSSTDGWIGNGLYCKENRYLMYNAEHYYPILHKIYKDKGSILLEQGFPTIWNLEFLRIHNCMITSSVVIEKDILCKINNMKPIAYAEDYDCWLRALEHTDSVYIKDVCFYYDNRHGYGQMHGY
jgi:glycosyltransferase involved in cell wall biosynthesis